MPRGGNNAPTPRTTLRTSTSLVGGRLRPNAANANANVNASASFPRPSCNIGPVVKRYVKPIMQALTMDIRQYNMRLVTTKCLNTAVMFMVLFFGRSALKDTEFCDVQNVANRHQAEINHNTMLVRKMTNDILRTTKNRFVYYIMLTDGKFVGPDGRNAFFPGHVMVWEKVPSATATGGPPRYYIYQSYINEYDYAGSTTFRETPSISASKMAFYLESLAHFAQTPVWDERMVKFWKDLTNVDTSNMLGCSPQDAFFMCYRRKKNAECLRNLHSLVTYTLRRIPAGADGAIYGDPSKYNAREEALTNGEMRAAFSELKQRLDDMGATVK